VAKIKMERKSREKIGKSTNPTEHKTENLDIFKSVLKIFHLENPKHKPASESFVTSVKRTMG
jgi:hypothetical protein